ncbi:MAG: DUF2973 domain-containing protein [Leptolyngbya sp. BL-A-14]
MLLHLLYIIAFTTLAFLAVGNLIRNLMTLGADSQRTQPPRGWSQAGSSRLQAVPHPEFLDTSGNVINEPLLVMRSMSVEDAREQLDALYESSPGANPSGASDRREDP